MGKIYTILHILFFILLQPSSAQTKFRLTPVLSNFKSVPIRNKSKSFDANVLCSLALIGSLAVHGFRRKNRQKSAWLCEKERKLLYFLLKNRAKQVTTIDLNELLACTKKSQESQRRIRHLLINQINFKLEIKYQIKDAIERTASEEDKRMYNYRLKPGIESKIQLIINPINSLYYLQK